MKQSNILKIISFNIRYFRKQKGWSQEKLAEQCNLHRTYIGAIERAERNLTIGSLQIISSALDVEIETLITKNSYVTYK